MFSKSAKAFATQSVFLLKVNFQFASLLHQACGINRDMFSRSKWLLRQSLTRIKNISSFSSHEDDVNLRDAGWGAGGVLAINQKKVTFLGVHSAFIFSNFKFLCSFDALQAWSPLEQRMPLQSGARRCAHGTCIEPHVPATSSHFHTHTHGQDATQELERVEISLNEELGWGTTRT